MPYQPFGTLPGQIRSDPTINARFIRGGTIAAQELILAATGYMRSQNFDLNNEVGWAIYGTGDAFFYGDFTIGGTILVGGNIILTGSGSISTSLTGQRVELDAGGTNGVQFFTGSAQELEHGYIFAETDNGGADERLGLHIVAPAISEDAGADVIAPRISLYSETDDESTTPVQVELAIASFGGVATPNLSPPQFKLTDSFILMLEDGSATDPALTWNNASSSGFYKISGSQDLGLTINNTHSVRFTSTGVRLNDGNSTTPTVFFDGATSTGFSRVASSQDMQAVVNGSSVARFGDGFIGPLTTWSPTATNLTVGNGSTVARYMRIGDMVFAWYHFTLGSTSAVTGAVAVPLPLSADSNYVSGEEMFGVAYIRAAGTQHGGMVRYLATDTVQFLALNTAGTYATVAGLSATVPATFTTGDDLSFFVVYETDA